MHLGMVLLAIWLILNGVAAVVPQVSGRPLNILLAVIAIGAGILF